MPKNCVYSVEEREGDKEVKRHVHRVQRIRDAEIVRWNHPPEFPAWVRREFCFPAMNLIELDDVIVAPASGAVWSPGGHVFMESIGSLNKALTFGKVMPEMMLKPRRHSSVTDTRDTVVIPCPPASYFHWMFEVMPSLIHASKRFPNALLLLYPDRPDYVSQSLLLWLGEAQYARRVIESEVPLQVGRAAFLTMPSASGFVRPSDALMIRDLFLGTLQGGAGASPGRKIFISRRGSKARTISDIDQLEDEHARQDFKILRLEELPWRDQVLAFSTATHVAGLHGAGFSNIIFSPQNCHIQEIFPQGYTNDCYARLASGLGLGYIGTHPN